MREVPEWVGNNDQAMPPNSVFRRLLRKQAFACPICTRMLVPANITIDHRLALCLGGGNRESNLQLICTNPCSIKKSGIEVSLKSQADRWMDLKYNVKQMREKRRDKWREKWKRKVSGKVVPR